MTNDEKNEIVQEVLAALRNNAKSISALTPTSDPSGTALIEISGGNSVRLNDLKNFMTGNVKPVGVSFSTTDDSALAIQISFADSSVIYGYMNLATDTQSGLMSKEDKKKIVTLTSQYDALDILMDRVTDSVDALGGTIDSISDRVGDTENRLDNIIVQDTGQETDKAMSQKAVTDALESVDGRIDTIETLGGANSDSITALEGKTSTLEESITEHTGDISTLDEQVSAIGEDIAELRTANATRVVRLGAVTSGATIQPATAPEGVTQSNGEIVYDNSARMLLLRAGGFYYSSWTGKDLSAYPLSRSVVYVAGGMVYTYESGIMTGAGLTLERVADEDAMEAMLELEKDSPGSQFAPGRLYYVPEEQ